MLRYSKRSHLYWFKFAEKILNCLNFYGLDIYCIDSIMALISEEGVLLDLLLTHNN